MISVSTVRISSNSNQHKWRTIIFIDVFSSNCLKTICWAWYICYSINNINFGENPVFCWSKIKTNSFSQTHLSFAHLIKWSVRRDSGQSLSTDKFDRRLCTYLCRRRYRQVHWISSIIDLYKEKATSKVQKLITIFLCQVLGRVWIALLCQKSVLNFSKGKLSTHLR